MKKTFFSFILTLLAFSAAAGNVTFSTARGIAEGVFCTTRSGGVSLVWDGTDGNTRGGDPTFYVFNYDGGGFIIISADDRAYPVLGYSPKGSFKIEGMPDNMRDWFAGYSRQIEYIRSTDIEQNPQIGQLWKKVTTPSTVKDLKTADWDQETPYNLKCPKNTLTGCVATSTATIMFHHKWPKTTPGTTLPSYMYSPDGRTQTENPGHNLATSYDWDSMLSSYGESATKASTEAVSTLMYDVGTALQLNYGYDGTSGYSDDVAPILVKYFDYDSCAVTLYKDGFTTKEWYDRMRGEIDANRPVSYGASDKVNSAGHQFVLDGYGTDDTFLFNFGWSGVGNALYRIDAIYIDKYQFNYFQAATVNIKPNEGGKGQNREKQIQFILSNDMKGGLSLYSGTISKGNTVKIVARNVCNNNRGTFSGTEMESLTAKYAMCLMDRRNNIKQIFGETETFTLESGYLFSDTVTCNITCDLDLGDKFVYCYNSGASWTPVTIDYSLYNYAFSDKTINMLDELGALDFPAIKINPEGYSAGDVLDLRLENCYYIPTIVWTFDGRQLDNGINSVQLTAGKHTIKAEVSLYKNSTKGSAVRTETLVRVINVN